MSVETDIWSRANHLVNHYGEAALEHAAQRANQLLGQVDIEGAALWWRIFRLVKDIQRTERRCGEQTH